MISQQDMRPYADVLRTYQELVSKEHEAHLGGWPLLNGWDLVEGTYKGWRVAFLQDKPFSVMTRGSGVGELSDQVIRLDRIDPSVAAAVTSRLESHFQAKARDAVLLISPEGMLPPSTFATMLRRHERTMGLSPMKIFLSHKGADKPTVREFRTTLRSLGFSPWLDEDSMRAGVELERGILKGFADSCAAVFFITENFKDEDFLASEVNYALAEKRKKGQAFSIITLVFNASVARKNVPDLLHQYVWKEPANDLEALREIIEALPVALGEPCWR